MVNHKKRQSSKLEGILILLMFYYIVFGLVDVVRLQYEKSQKSTELGRLEHKYIHQQKVNVSLKKQLGKKDENIFIEQQARKLDYVYPEEHVFIDVSG
jgi:cell division protein FtsB